MAEIHSRAIRAAGYQVVGISGSSPESGLVAARRLNIPQSFESALELINSPDIDVVHVCTPNRLHAEQAHAALAVAKPVICEKPLATSSSDAAGLYQAAVSANVLTAVPFVYRYYPVVREIRGRIAAGEAGKLMLLHGSYLQDWLAAKSETNWRVDPSAGGPSRAFADIGVHWCDLMEFVTGHRITRLSSRLITSYPERGVSGRRIHVGNEDAAVVTFETDLGAAGSLTVSQISHGRKNRLWFSFDGSEGSYEFNQESPDSFWVGGLKQNSTVFSGSPGMQQADGSRLALLPAGHPQGYQDAFNAFMSDAYNSFGGGTPIGLPTFADGLRAAVITDAVIRSSVTQGWVSIPTAPGRALPSDAMHARP